ncbi:MAG: hypothetical protein JXA82_06955 [Sedimentisphaerales bacterium]|nr:hypothetical protein [Sedimentisphaerales bacterium]
MRKILVFFILLAIVLPLVGCGTVQGIGEDITWVGKKTSEMIDPDAATPAPRSYSSRY